MIHASADLTEYGVAYLLYGLLDHLVEGCSTAGISSTRPSNNSRK
jgi:hypothetical protein